MRPWIQLKSCCWDLRFSKQQLLSRRRACSDQPDCSGTRLHVSVCISYSTKVTFAVRCCAECNTVIR